MARWPLLLLAFGCTESTGAYPAPWVRCTQSQVVRNQCGIVYEYSCKWSQTDCPGGIGDPVICLSSHSPCPEDYGYCHMAPDRTRVSCSGIVDGPQPELTKPGHCHSHV